MPEDPAARGPRGDLGAREAVGHRRGEPVQRGEAPVDERVLGQQDLAEIRIAVEDDVGEQQLGLDAREVAEVGAHRGEDRRVLREGVELVEAPQVGEVREHACARAGVVEHGAYGSAEPFVGIEQPVARGVEQRVVRRRVPEEERQPRRELPRVERAHGLVAGTELPPEEEVRRLQQRGDRPRDRFPRVRERLGRGGPDRHDAIDLRGGQRSAPRPAPQRLDEAAEAGVVGGAGRGAPDEGLAPVGLRDLAADLDGRALQILDRAGRERRARRTDGREAALVEVRQVDARDDHVAEEIAQRVLELQRREARHGCGGRRVVIPRGRRVGRRVARVEGAGVGHRVRRSVRGDVGARVGRVDDIGGADVVRGCLFFDPARREQHRRGDAGRAGEGEGAGSGCVHSGFFPCGEAPAR